MLPAAATPVMLSCPVPPASVTNDWPTMFTPSLLAPLVEVVVPEPVMVMGASADDTVALTPVMPTPKLLLPRPAPKPVILIALLAAAAEMMREFSTYTPALLLATPTEALPPEPVMLSKPPPEATEMVEMPLPSFRMATPRLLLLPEVTDAPPLPSTVKSPVLADKVPPCETRTPSLVLPPVAALIPVTVSALLAEMVAAVAG